MNIILLAPSGAAASAISQLSLDPDDEVVVVASSQPDTGARTLILSPALASATKRAERTLGGTALGRNVLRLTPLDAGRRFAGATRRSKGLRAEIAQADLIVVLERDGILAGWHALRRAAPDARAVYGIPAAKGLIASTRH